MHSDDSVSEGALMQKLTILGATGATGQQVVRQALERGHQVTALVRDPMRHCHTGTVTPVTLHRQDMG